MIFVYVCSTWTLYELKTRFETLISRNVVNGVSFVHLYYLITLMAYLCSQWTTNVQIKFFMFDWSIYSLFVLNRSCKRKFLQIMIFEYVWSAKKISWTKNAFWNMNNKKWCKWCKVVSSFLFNNSYALTVITMNTKCPNQIL
jgi:hypothetical protein